MAGRKGARTRLLAPAILATVVMAAALPACGVAPRRTLDARSIESQIAGEIARQYRLSPGTVTAHCPDGIPALTGRTFTCDATLDGQVLPVDGTVTSRTGRYRVQPAAAVIVVPSVVADLESRIAAQLQAPATVTCGAKAVLVVPTGGTFACTATVDGQARLVTVTVDDLQGHVRFNLAPPATAAR
jgi:hypothetical protein